MKLKIAMIAVALFTVFSVLQREWSPTDRILAAIITLVGAVIVAGLLWLVSKAAQKYRLKNPGPMAIWTGRIVYWLGFALAIYCAGLEIFLAFKAKSYDPATVRLLGDGVFAIYFYWAIGRSIKYLLGR